MTGLRSIYRYLGRFLLFWRDFLIGDDWWGAVIALVGVALTYVAVRYRVTAFWVLGLFVTISLVQSLWRMKRRERPVEQSPPGAPLA